MRFQLSEETRKDPSQTGKLRNDFAKSILRVFKFKCPADLGELYTRLGRVLDKYLRSGYLAGQIYAAVVLKQYKPPFKPIADEDGLSNIIANAQITLEQLLDGSYQPNASLITVLTTRLMYSFHLGLVDFSRAHGITEFNSLVQPGAAPNVIAVRRMARYILLPIHR